jgi:hypothetical protein
MLDIALYELTARREQDMFARQPGMGVQQSHHIL